VSVLFVPGRPGFSSRCEAEVLAPCLGRLQWNARFWDDPWRGQPNGHGPSWDAYLAALQQSISEYVESEDLTIAADSFAVHPVLIVLQRMRWMPSRLATNPVRHNGAAGHD
jgi:hypothetical protein